MVASTFLFLLTSVVVFTVWKWRSDIKTSIGLFARNVGHFARENIVVNPVLTIVCASIFGFLVAWLIFFFEELPFVHSQAILPYFGAKDVRGIFNHLPNFLTWIMLFVIHTGMATALGAAALQNIQSQVLSQYTIKPNEAATAAFLVAVMIVISSCSYILPFNSGHYYSWPDVPLNHLWLKIVLLLAISIICASFGVLGQIFIGCYCRHLLTESMPDNALEIYGKLKVQSERFLLITGSILSVGIVTVFFFHAALDELKHSELFPVQGVVLFGLLFTIFIAISFFPTRVLIIDVGRKLLEQELPKPLKASAQETKDWLLARKEMENYLQLKLDVVETLRYAIPVLGPMISSFVPGLFGKHG